MDPAASSQRSRACLPSSRLIPFCPPLPLIQTQHILSNTFPLKACKLLSLILFLPYLSIPLIHTMHSVIKSYVLY